MSAYPAALRPRLAEIRLLVLDVDGVLTDGRLYYSGEGEAMKGFHAHDGLGIRLLSYIDVEVAVITARESPPVVRRMRDLAVTEARFGVENKGHAIAELIAARGLTRPQVAFVGDDLLDLPALARAGVSITVANGHPLLKSRVDWVTASLGGQGAVREIADGLLDARDMLEESCRALLRDLGESAPGLMS